MSDNPLPASAERPLMRRQLLLGGAAAALLAGCSSSGSKRAANGTGSSADSGGTTTTTPASSSAPTSPATCVLSPEVTAGPYHLDGPLVRRDITEGKPGVPLELRVVVFDVDGCTPVEGAVVDVWHCDAGGEYSGFNGSSLAATQAQGRNEKRYLRGVQLTDASGVATFDTIFPGWYEGRTVHIHLQVVEGAKVGTSYDGGHVAHVGQAFFEESDTARIMGLDPYRAHTGRRTTNDQDSIFRQAGPNATATLARTGGDAEAYRCDVTCVIDPAATPGAAPMF